MSEEKSEGIKTIREKLSELESLIYVKLGAKDYGLIDDIRAILSSLENEEQ